MAKNRKKNSGELRFGSAVKALLICLLIGGAGVGYVEQQTRLYILGGQCRELEAKLDKLRRENAGKARTLDQMQTPVELEARVKQMNLGLMPPRPDQIVRLMEAPPVGPWPGANRLYADRSLPKVQQP